tara:strand:+ start:1718 stop:2071 length:354 start_codon:yes stop_codon:yes gene_type:complete
MKKETTQQPQPQPQQPTQQQPTRQPMIKQLVINCPDGDNKVKHNLINKIRELLNIYTKLSVQNIGFNCGIDTTNNMCYNIDIIKYNEDIMKLYEELKKIKDIELIYETQQVLYFKLK